MNHGWRASGPHRLAQEARFFPVAFDEMNPRARRIGKRAGDNQTGKSGPRAEIDPCARLRGERNELQRVRHMAGPQFGLGGTRDEIDALLPLHEEVDKKIEAGGCFT